MKKLNLENLKKYFIMEKDFPEIWSEFLETINYPNEETLIESNEYDLEDIKLPFP